MAMKETGYAASLLGGLTSGFMAGRQMRREREQDALKKQMLLQEQANRQERMAMEREGMGLRREEMGLRKQGMLDEREFRKKDFGLRTDKLGFEKKKMELENIGRASIAAFALLDNDKMYDALPAGKNVFSASNPQGKNIIDNVFAGKYTSIKKGEDPNVLIGVAADGTTEEIPRDYARAIALQGFSPDAIMEREKTDYTREKNAAIEARRKQEFDLKREKTTLESEKLKRELGGMLPSDIDKATTASVAFKSAIADIGKEFKKETDKQNVSAFGSYAYEAGVKAKEAGIPAGQAIVEMSKEIERSTRSNEEKMKLREKMNEQFTQGYLTARAKANINRDGGVLGRGGRVQRSGEEQKYLPGVGMKESAEEIISRIMKENNYSREKAIRYGIYKNRLRAAQ